MRASVPAVIKHCSFCNTSSCVWWQKLLSAFRQAADVSRLCKNKKVKRWNSGKSERHIDDVVDWRLSNWLCAGSLFSYFNGEFWSCFKGLAISVSTSFSVQTDKKKKKKIGCAVESAWFLLNTNKAGVRAWWLGGDGSSKHQAAVLHRALACSFTSTLYSLEPVTVNLSISPPGFKKRTYEEGAEWPECVHSARSASAQRRGPHHTDIKCSLSAPDLLLSFSTTPFIFHSKKIFLFISLFCAHLSLSLPLSFTAPLPTLFSFHKHGDRGLLFLLFCA